MSEELTKKQKKELQRLIEEINEEAKNIVEDYVENPSEISGSIVQVNQESPFLDETFKDKSWKKVIKGGVEDALNLMSQNKKDLVKKKKK